MNPVSCQCQSLFACWGSKLRVFVVGQTTPTMHAMCQGDVPSKGEKPPLSINSRSQSCLSVRRTAGRVSASAASWAWRGKSLARRSLVGFVSLWMTQWQWQWQVKEVHTSVRRREESWPWLWLMWGEEMSCRNSEREDSKMKIFGEESE